MTPDRNAAIWYSADGFDAAAKGMNGRRMAGESFLKGYFRHAQVSEFVCATHTKAEANSFQKLARSHGVNKQIRAALLESPHKIAPVETLFFSSPGLAAECWRRLPHGNAAWSICGLTHTISTKGTISSFMDTRAAPQQEWDAVICASKAVKVSVDFLLDQVDQHLKGRFAGKVPPRFQTPIIPLGINCDDFIPDAAKGRALRQRLGIPDADIVALIVARLTPHEKFDPLPVYIAMAEAQKELGTSHKLHLLLYGDHPDTYSKEVFQKNVTTLMPGVGIHILPNQDRDIRLAAFSAAQMFLFPIDNVQESFGLAPVEAMAAGLPVIASDWDGIRDTVSGDVGFRIRTLAARPEHLPESGLRQYGGSDTYIQYLGQASATTRIDVHSMIKAIVALARNHDLRQQMGLAAKLRANSLFDWSRVVPQYQDLFAELSRIRRRAGDQKASRVPAALHPVAPSPAALFASFPSARIQQDTRRYVAVALDGRVGVAETLAMRNYVGVRRIMPHPDQLVRLHAALPEAKQDGLSTAELATQTGIPILEVERMLLWLLKYHFASEKRLEPVTPRIAN